MDAVDHLIVGGDSRIGSALHQYLESRGVSVASTTRRGDVAAAGRIRLDLLDPDSADLPRAKAVYLVAAMARLRQCREEPGLARRVNVIASESLARRFADEGAFVLFLSTDMVFDGARPGYGPEDPPCPASVYGSLKAEAEAAVLAQGERVGVLRLSKVIERNDGLFGDWIDTLRAGGTVRAFHDLYAAPVAIARVLQAMEAIAVRREGGIWQLTGPVDVNYVEIARFLARRAGRPDASVEPAAAASAGMLPEECPRYTALDSSRVRDRFGIAAGDPWQELELELDLDQPAPQGAAR